MLVLFRIGIFSTALIEHIIIFFRKDKPLKNFENFISYAIVLLKTFFVSSMDYILGLSAITAFAFFNPLTESFKYRLFELPRIGILTGIALVFLVELSYYWEHRIKHTLPIFWAAHAVHHTCTTTGIAGGLRTPWLLGSVSTLIFFAPIVLIGFHPADVFLFTTIQRVYGVLSHVQLIKTLGPLERFIIITPSHHRVHHATDHDLLNRNFGAFLNIYDRIFGTFTYERPNMGYGFIGKVNSENLIDSVFAGWKPIIKNLISARSITDVFGAFFRRMDRPSNKY